MTDNADICYNTHVFVKNVYMARSEYIKRICDEELAFQLECAGAVVVQGPKWCGKTRTSEEMARSVVKLQDPLRKKEYHQIAQTMPSLLLEGDSPRLIDEWQDEPDLWNLVRGTVDERGGAGHFILTGSAVPRDEKGDDKEPPRHSGTGRFAWLKMRPMSLAESGESTGVVSLGALFEGGDEISATSKVTVPDYAHLICRGGWPEAVLAKSHRVAYQKSINYVEAVINEDVHRVDGVERNPALVRLVLRSLARNITTLTATQTILGDIRNHMPTTSIKTLDSYLNALRRIFVIEDEPAWMPSIRSKTAIRTSHKRQLADPSIATAILGIKPERLLKDFSLFGFLFESMCVRDMRVYAQANDGEVLHYRDASGQEIDMVVSLRDGRWGAVEVKLGGGQIEEASRNLLALKERVDSESMGSPSFLMVLTGTGFAYRRTDGIFVVPLGCLRQ